MKSPLDTLRSPLTFLQSRLETIPHRDVLGAEEAWWKNEGIAISNAIDRAGTPWLRMFDRFGKRVALAQRAMADALSYAERRVAFGKRILDHPLLRHQFDNRLKGLRSAFALAWDPVRLLNDVWMERPPY